ncbi:MAG: chitobiase/beta-hexosaminidase C-terminal domain-containing protein [Clostridiales bacterium]|nr:chitobiase/beta-hexosaminidase C-terminal domain-containing protein [Clostridiales bacterium]
MSPGYLGSSLGLAGSASDVTISMPSGSANYGYLFEDNPSGVYDYSFVIEMPTSTEGVFAGKEPGSDAFSDIYGLHFGIPGALEVTLNPRSAVEGFFGVKVEGSSYTPNYTTYIDVEGIGKSFAPALGATFEVSGEIDLGGKTVSIYFDDVLYAQNLPIPKDGPIDAFTFFTPDTLNYYITIQDFQISKIESNPSALGSWSLNEQLKGLASGSVLGNLALGDFGAWNGSFVEMLEETGEKIAKIEYGAGAGFGIKLFESGKGAGTFVAEFDIMEESALSSAEATAMGGAWLDLGFYNGQPADGNFPFKVLINYSNQGDGQANRQGPQFCPEFRDLAPQVFMNDHEWYHVIITRDYVSGIDIVDVYDPIMARIGHFERLFADGGKSDEVEGFAIFSVNATNAFYIKNAEIAYSEPPDAPTLLSPVDLAPSAALRTYFKWSPSDAMEYRLQISEDQDFSKLKLDKPLGLSLECELSESEALSPRTNYWWRVVAVKADGEHASDAWSFMTDFAVPEDGVYEAGLYGLIPGDWDGWDQEYKDLYGANYYIDIPMRNAEIIQSLLDKAVARAEVTESNPEGYTTVLLPPGIYCVGADVMKRSQSALRIKYDYTVLKGSGDPEGVGSASLENGGTVIKTPFQYMQGPGVGDYRVTAVAIDGGEFGSSDARDHVRIENFELDGGSHWTGDYNWDSSYGGAGYNGYDFGWDVTSHGIVINVDRLVDHVYINHMYVHSYRGEMMYIGGHATGYLEVSFSKVGDTNASTNNLDGNAYYDHDNQWGLEDYNSRFWMEFSPRQCSPGDSYEWLPLPDYAPQEMKDAFEEGKSISYFTRNRYLNADYTKASTIAIAQAMNDSTYMHFVDNTFDNSGVEENYKKSPYYSMDEEEFTRLKELSNDGLTYSDANTKNSIFQMAGGAFGDGGGLFIKENKVIEHHGAFFDYNNGGPTGENIWFVRSGNITVEGNEGTIGASGAPIFGFTGSWPPYLMHTDHVSIKGNKFTAAESGVISVLVSGPNDYGIGESFTIGWWGDFVAGQPINESNVNNDSLHPLSVNPYVPYDNGPELVYGMSAYLGDSIEISGNEFTNAQAPKSYFKFWGLMPLFKDNSYIGANSAPVETSAQSPEIKSVCEEILVKALDAHEAELFASDEAGRSYRDGQPLLITLDSGSAELAFVQTGAGYVADRAFALKAGESAKFVFDSEKGLWVNTEAPEKVPDKDPEKAPDVKASPVSGAYSSPLLVELESDAGEIWYTTDGSDPRTSDKREKYASAITIALPATIKAYASQADMIDGEISEFNYTLIETPAPVFSLSPSELSPSSVVYGYVPEENTFELSFAGSQTIEDLVFYFEGEAFDASDADVVAGSGADGSLDAFKEGDKAHIRVAPKAGLDTGLYTGRLIYESQGAKTALDISFLVAPADISGLSIQPIQPARRTGSPIEPEVLISGLELGVDFTVSYLDNVNVGTATVIATGIGNYTGTIEAFFDIVAETATDYFPSYYAPYYAQAPSPTPVPKVSAIPGFYATSADVVTNLALELYKAKLFVGIGLDASGKPVFELERPLTRLEAIVIVLRLLGLEKAANESLYKNPFSDVPAWGDRAAAYAFRAGITVGVDEEHTLLASDRLVTAQEFTAFLLRALGYSEASGDFDYQNALGKSVKVGMFAQSELDAFAKDASFLRAEAVISMVDALRTSVKGGGTLLIDKLADQVGKAVAESLVKNSSALYRPGR